VTAYVYILASRPQGTLYIGSTKDLVARTAKHRRKSATGFTGKYQVRTLVYSETFDDIAAAMIRERQMKEWRRAWKIELIENKNPDWSDLYPGLSTGTAACR
jgi:putative endonuclease